MILYGKPVAEQIRREYVKNFFAPKRQRTLTVIADETSDQSYLKAIRSAAVEWDVNVQEARDEREAAKMNALRVIDIRKEPKTMHGFYSMDGQSPDSLLGMYKGLTSAFTPCTPEAIVCMLDYYDIPVEGKNVVILGRGERVGKPLAMIMLARDATVTVCHSKTRFGEMMSMVADADIVVCATGQKDLIDYECIDCEWMGGRKTIVNVGGDYDEETGHDGLRLIPYRGGVGCVTTAVLMRHVVM